MYDHPHAAYISFFCSFFSIHLNNTVKMPNILIMVKKFEVINCKDSNYWPLYIKSTSSNIWSISYIYKAWALKKLLYVE
uniref:Putative ovule protein n=1 Tax=Solanum chacoense TaxID=4108 RepID=A0A0V0I0P4_SOLCH